MHTFATLLSDVLKALWELLKFLGGKLWEYGKVAVAFLKSKIEGV